jgi:hypothetical protein
MQRPSLQAATPDSNIRQSLNDYPNLMTSPTTIVDVKRWRRLTVVRRETKEAGR